MDDSRSSGSPELAGADDPQAQVDRFVAGCPPGIRLVAAFSGGLDSTVLLDCLVRACRDRGLALGALHVNHGLSPNADTWVAHCRSVCAQLDVPLAVVAVRVGAPAVADDGLEAAARAARYRAFDEADGDVVVLAQHRDDQAETLLLNLLRGCGVAGAAAAPRERALAGGRRLVRPWLGVPRDALHSLARRRGLAWVEDESNGCLRHARNAIRLNVLPELERIRSGAAATLARASAGFAEAQSLLDEMAEADWRNAGGERETLPVAALAAMRSPRRQNLLRYWLASAGVRVPSSARLRTLGEQSVNARSDSCLRVDFGDGCVVRAWRGCLYLTHIAAAPPQRLVVALDDAAAARWSGGEFRLPPTVGDGIAMASLAGPLELRRRAGGERLRLHPGRPTRPLKDHFQELGVPPWQRDFLPLLWAGGRLLWVGGLGIDCGVRAAPGEPGRLPQWAPDRHAADRPFSA
jgi:tRNA(Ile)-lysidine synthase